MGYRPNSTGSFSSGLSEMVYQYQNSLQREFEARRSRNAQYGLRAFSRDLNIGASTLSEILSFRKGVSLERGRRLAEKLQLAPDEESLFLLSIKAQHSRSRRSKEIAHKELLSQIENLNDPPTMTVISDWITEAVYKIFQQPTSDRSVEALAKRLSTPQFMVVSALRYLRRLGFIPAPENKSYLKHLGRNKRINVDKSQILNQAQAALKKSHSAFSHRLILLEPKNREKAESIMKAALREVEQLESKGKNAKLYYFCTQLFCPEKIDQGGT